MSLLSVSSKSLGAKYKCGCGRLNVDRCEPRKWLASLQVDLGLPDFSSQRSKMTSLVVREGILPGESLGNSFQMCVQEDDV